MGKNNLAIMLIALIALSIVLVGCKANSPEVNSTKKPTINVSRPIPSKPPVINRTNITRPPVINRTVPNITRPIVNRTMPNITRPPAINRTVPNITRPINRTVPLGVLPNRTGG